MARITAVLVVVALAAGCDSGGPAISKKALDKIVLHRDDLGPTFSAFYAGPVLSADVGPPRLDPQRFRRQGGWIARYRRAGSLQIDGPLVVASRADLFDSSAGAGKDFALYETQLDRSPHDRSVRSIGGLGDKAAGIVDVQGSGSHAVVSVTIVWLEANATAELEATGFEPRLRFADVVALARKQQAHLRRAQR